MSRARLVIRGRHARAQRPSIDSCASGARKGSKTVALLEVENLTKVYNEEIRANDRVSLTIEAGEVFGLLGPNGAGKTTLVMQIMGLLTPTSGAIHIGGTDIIRDPDYARQACSYQPQGHVPINGLKTRTAIELVGRMRGGSKEDVNRRMDELVKALEIDEWLERRGESLSGGIRRLTAFCMAAVHPGELVILDEPSNDVDPLRRRLLWREVSKLAEEGAGVLLITHNVLEAERSVHRLAIMEHGRVIDAGTPTWLEGGDERHWRLEFTLATGNEMPDLPSMLSDPVTFDRRVITTIEHRMTDQAREWAEGLQEKGLLTDYLIRPATLEDAYMQLIEQAEKKNGERGGDE
jgi:ABC-2 type transport system ATP-binding protein